MIMMDVPPQRCRPCECESAYGEGDHPAAVVVDDGDHVQNGGGGARRSPVVRHLIVFQHGILGHQSDWINFLDAVGELSPVEERSARLKEWIECGASVGGSDPPSAAVCNVDADLERDLSAGTDGGVEAVFYAMRSNGEQPFATLEGIERCAHRMVAEIDGLLARSVDEGRPVRHMSMVGHSLGGIFNRYVLRLMAERYDLVSGNSNTDNGGSSGASDEFSSDELVRECLQMHRLQGEWDSRQAVCQSSDSYFRSLAFRSSITDDSVDGHQHPTVQAGKVECSCFDSVEQINAKSNKNPLVMEGSYASQEGRMPQAGNDQAYAAGPSGIGARRASVLGSYKAKSLPAMFRMHSRPKAAEDRKAREEIGRIEMRNFMTLATPHFGIRRNPTSVANHFVNFSLAPLGAMPTVSELTLRDGKGHGEPINLKWPSTVPWWSVPGEGPSWRPSLFGRRLPSILRRIRLDGNAPEKVEDSSEGLLEDMNDANSCVPGTTAGMKCDGSDFVVTNKEMQISDDFKSHHASLESLGNCSVSDSELVEPTPNSSTASTPDGAVDHSSKSPLSVYLDYIDSNTSRTRNRKKSPLLHLMGVDPRYLAPLASFRRRIAYSNVSHDALVPYCTGALRIANPYLQGDISQEKCEQYDAVYLSSMETPHLLEEAERKRWVDEGGLTGTAATITGSIYNEGTVAEGNLKGHGEESGNNRKAGNKDEMDNNAQEEIGSSSNLLQEELCQMRKCLRAMHWERIDCNLKSARAHWMIAGEGGTTSASLHAVRKLVLEDPKIFNSAHPFVIVKKGSSW